MDKRYQVFVSSTYEDLREERSAVSHALLQVGCFPAGMELFPAADEDQWTSITRSIDESDYYIVIVAGRYGSLAADGMGYTEKEYRYALEQGIPTIGFLHRSPGKIPHENCEQDPDKQAKLEAFKTLIQQKTVAWWTTPDGLGREVIASITPQIRNKPRIGWIRADQAADEKEVLALRRTIDKLQEQLAALQHGPLPGTEDFEQGEDKLELVFTFSILTPDGGGGWETEEAEHTFIQSWNDWFRLLAVELPTPEEEIDETLAREVGPTIERLTTRKVAYIRLRRDGFLRIKIQLVALGLIRPVVSNNRTYWQLTDHGQSELVRALATRRSDRTKGNG